MIFDALIIGAGPAGASLALLLARAGWSVAIVEKKKFPRRKVCGEYISASSFPLLRQLGIFEGYPNHFGPEVKRVGLFAADKVLWANMPAAENVEDQWGRALGREHLDSMLLNEAKLAGAEVWQPWSASNLLDHKSYFSCTVTSNKKSAVIAARLPVLANGSWERSLIASTRSHKPSDLLAFKASFSNAILDEDLMPLLSFPGGYGGLVQDEKKRVTLSCCVRRDQLENIRKQNPGVSAGDGVLNHIISHCKGAESVLSHAQRDDCWLSAGTLQPGIRKCYHKGVFYIGNIAGEAHPVIAEGISMAMQSAWILSEILLASPKDRITAQDFDRLGQAYRRQWKAQFANRIHAAALFAYCVTRPKLMSLLLPLFNQFPNLLGWATVLSGKTKTLRLIDAHSSSTKQFPSGKENAS